MKTVLVTGGVVRLGKAISERLRSLGWRVLTTSHRADAGADIVADFSDPLGAARCYSAALSALGGVPPDAVVNNAALFTGDAELLKAVNYDAPVKLTALMAGRETEGRGAIVNILDCRVLPNGGAAACGAYEKTKRDLLEYTKKSALMFSDTLRVNAVAPGPVIAPEAIRESAGETPVGRPSPMDVADAVAFLLSAQATTGCVVPVDGGQNLIA